MRDKMVEGAKSSSGNDRMDGHRGSKKKTLTKSPPNTG